MANSSSHSAAPADSIPASFVTIAESLVARYYPLAGTSDAEITLPRHKLQRLLSEAALSGYEPHDHQAQHNTCLKDAAGDLEYRVLRVADALSLVSETAPTGLDEILASLALRLRNAADACDRTVLGRGADDD